MVGAEISPHQLAAPRSSDRRLPNAGQRGSPRIRPGDLPRTTAAPRCRSRPASAAAGSDLERARWTRMGLALVLAEATGRRLGSIRQLRWEDADLRVARSAGARRRTGRGREWVVPCPAPLLEELKHFRKRLGAIGGWLFAGDRKPEQPMAGTSSTSGCASRRRKRRCRSSSEGLAPLPAEVGDRAKAPLAQGRSRGGRLEGHRDTAHLLPAARHGDAARGHERGAKGARRRARVAEPLRNRTTNSASAVRTNKHRGPNGCGAHSYTIESGRRDLNPRPPEPHWPLGDGSITTN